MSYIRFNHVFAGLMLLSILSAYILSPRITNPPRAALQNIFAPVAVPTRAIASWVHRRFEEEPKDDFGPGGTVRSDATLLEENRQLRDMVAMLGVQLDNLKALNADRESVGKDVRQFCTPVSVMGGDPGPRESLALTGSTIDGVQTGQPVLYRGGLAGRIDRSGVGGAQVQLVTDTGFKATACFARFVKDEQANLSLVKLPSAPPLVLGSGNGKMKITSLSLKEIESAGVKEGDLVRLDDPDWPPIVQGQGIGRITKITPSSAQPLFAEIEVSPQQNLMMLREVMVVTK